tara:strand:- start:2276 stop:2473 length:198 start_codon:yes stop_codon:yes gene_type:complete
MKRKDLCTWLRANSSGVYRPAAEAAAEIERLEIMLQGVINNGTFIGDNWVVNESTLDRITEELDT